MKSLNPQAFAQLCGIKWLLHLTDPVPENEREEQTQCKISASFRICSRAANDP